MSELQEKLARRLSRLDSTDTVESIEDIIHKNKLKNGTKTPTVSPVKLKHHTSPSTLDQGISKSVSYTLHPTTEKKDTSPSLNRSHSHQGISSPTHSPSSPQQKSWARITKEEQIQRDRAALIQRGLHVEPAEVKHISATHSFLRPPRTESSNSPHNRQQKQQSEDEQEDQQQDSDIQYEHSDSDNDTEVAVGQAEAEERLVDSLQEKLAFRLSGVDSTVTDGSIDDTLCTQPNKLKNGTDQITNMNTELDDGGGRGIVHDPQAQEQQVQQQQQLELEQQKQRQQQKQSELEQQKQKQQQQQLELEQQKQKQQQQQLELEQQKQRQQQEQLELDQQNQKQQQQHLELEQQMLHQIKLEKEVSLSISNSSKSSVKNSTGLICTTSASASSSVTDEDTDDNDPSDTAQVITDIKQSLHGLEDEMNTVRTNNTTLQHNHPSSITNHDPEIHIDTLIRNWTQGSSNEAVRYEIYIEVRHSRNTTSPTTTTTTVQKTYMEFRRFRASLGLTLEGMLTSNGGKRVADYFFLFRFLAKYHIFLTSESSSFYVLQSPPPHTSLSVH